MNKNKRRNRIMLMIVLLLAISIGFAALATTLKINGSAIVNKGSWNIYWDEDSILVTTGSITDTLPIVGNDASDKPNTKVSWNVNFDVPGDFYEFTIDAVNAGSMDAVITDIKSTITDGVDPVVLPNYINYSVTYADGSNVSVNDPLNKADTTTNPITPTRKKYKVRIEFLDTITPEEMDAIPENGVNYEFEYDVTYGQASVNSLNKTAVALKTQSGENILGKSDDELKSYYGSRINGFKTIYPIDWQLFYSDEDYVFLIASDYLKREYIPSEIAPDQSFECNYTATKGFNDVYNDSRWSSGAQSDAIKNNPLTSKYLTWVSKYPTSTNNGIKATAYMMDTSIWADFSGNAAGSFAMGGPTLEMFIKSYNAANTLQIEEYDELRDRADYDSYSDQTKYGNVSEYGYYVKWVDFYGNSFSWTNQLSSPYLFNNDEVPNVWDIGNTYSNPPANGSVYYLASPSGYDSSNIYAINYMGLYSYSANYQYCQYGFRPLVAIPKSSLR